VKKSYTIKFASEDNNIELEQVNIKGEEIPSIMISIGKFVNSSGGSDGEWITMTQNEFQQFINDCQLFLDNLKTTGDQSDNSK
jgi:hypothetical protein